MNSRSRRRVSAALVGGLCLGAIAILWRERARAGDGEAEGAQSVHPVAAGEPPVIVDRLPETDREWPQAARGARALMVRAQHTHMELVTGGVVLPMILRLLPAQVLPDAPWALPPGELPPRPVP